MATSQIMLAGNSVTLVALPQKPNLRSVEWNVTDQVSSSVSPYTGQTQTFSYPGADMWSGTMELPPLKQTQADQWIAFLMECRGMANAFQLGDPAKPVGPLGAAGSAPVVDGAVATNNAAMATTLFTRGWKPNSLRLMGPGDYLQLGYRLHRNLDWVSSDASGRAQLNLWPSLREQPADGAALVLNKARGLFRLATNKRTWNADFTRLTRISFQVMEYR